MVISPAQSTLIAPPPPYEAELLLKLELNKLTLLLYLEYTAPPYVAELLVNMELFIFKFPLKLAIAPPPVALLFSNMQLSISNVP